MARVIFHLDMDAFYASVEQRDRPELKGRPVIVGAPPDRRGVVCAASYEARRFGVRSAMPSRTAGRLCPEGVFVRPRMEAYREESRRIMALIAAEGAEIEQVSVDEAYLDFSSRFPGLQADAALQAAVPLARALKETIRRERGLAASIGIGGNKLVAKLASDSGKPDGLLLIPERDKALFLRSFPVSALHGVGPVTARLLVEQGLPTVGHLQDYAGDLRALVGSFAGTLAAFARGEDGRPLDRDSFTKSISSETTFERDSADRPLLRAALREHAADIAAKLEKEGLAAQTVQVKVRYGDFTTLTRQWSVPLPVRAAPEIYRLSCLILAKHCLVNRPLRLLGVGVSNLCPPVPQLVFPFISEERAA
ncbi:MAG: DNA polymerase IV [Verrucomicrobium sp.]|nr:DNA polymerase IV [Verrucomicrobium sp.]